MGKYSLELKHGNEAEEMFAELAEKNGYIVTQATVYSNMVEHIDFHLESGSSSITLQVKKVGCMEKLTK